jgi:hypothetical protein
MTKTRRTVIAYAPQYTRCVLTQLSVELADSGFQGCFDECAFGLVLVPCAIEQILAYAIGAEFKMNGIELILAGHGSAGSISRKAKNFGKLWMALCFTRSCHIRGHCVI